MKNNATSTALGVFGQKKNVYLFTAQHWGQKDKLLLYSSSDGLNFGQPQPIEGIKSGRRFRLAKLGGKYFLTFNLPSEKDNYLYGSLSPDLLHWEKPFKIANFTGVGMLVPRDQARGRQTLYFGQDALRVAFSQDLQKWESVKEPLFRPEKNLEIEIANLSPAKNGLAIVYLLKGRLNDEPFSSLRTVLLDKSRLPKVLWLTAKVLWDLPLDWSQKEVNFLGVVEFRGRLVSYWEIEGEIFSSTHFPSATHRVNLTRIVGNPILEPRKDYSWESKAVFNPAAVYEEDKVHLIYRAIGDHDTSVLGYAVSGDGVQIDERLDSPIYVPTQPFECGNLTAPYCSISYLSGGGGNGGCEDPRIVRIEDKFYMTYVAFDGCNPPRVALTSIAVEDFLARRWQWSTPVLISPPDVVDKNACILPEKIRGKYVIFHRIFPDILIDFVDDLNFDGKTKWLKGEFHITPRPSFWDSRKLGVGAPPIKTEDGWLVIYQAVGDQDAGRYKMGAMLLDQEDPTRVLYRANYPILEPEENYENEGHKFGVVYPCGAVTIKDELFIYYGGADMVVCAARANLSQFLKQLKHDEVPQLKPVIIQPVYH